MSPLSVHLPVIRAGHSNESPFVGGYNCSGNGCRGLTATNQTLSQLDIDVLSQGRGGERGERGGAGERGRGQLSGGERENVLVYVRGLAPW